jgi:DnaJ-domain-containing protein 1
MTTILISRGYSGYHIKLKSDEQQAFRLCIDTLKSFIAPGQRSYNPPTREWFVDEDATDQMRRWLSYAETMTGARVEWIGGATYEDYESYADYEPEWTPPPPPRQKPKPKAVDPYQVLHLRETAPPELVKVAYRCLAQIHHPDRGGDEERMKAINRAYEKLAA